ncbi:xanthine dehydrogenase small subunit [Tepidamorphus gemmatus]|uniref:Xanthine dehydrogenase small subunit n=1 Tax=Tepidamorphus gemmatus TaxID=747076 RepID=A0A4R3MFL8_9HYPH|nr:xanthine dehydrogenase small subunit [Tepidamorphus gemmatus]TCT12515.1 xanthine dehydrogenase small subunit [Tepidamorphus gemmatus]
MAPARDAVRILRRGRVVEISGFAPIETLLDHLRLRERATGTKEGCAEGDCGACTVAIGRPGPDGGTVYRPVNACIHLLGMADGAEIVTVEDIGADGLHPIQQAFMDRHASQCGYCTPGFVMALFAFRKGLAGQPVSRRNVTDAIAGNLCRCTGYRPIIDAALDACADDGADGFGGKRTGAALVGLTDGAPLFAGDDTAFFAAPTNLDALAELHARHPDATLVAGATDVGLWITKQFRPIDKVIHLGRVAGLAGIADEGDALRIGAATTYNEAAAALAALDPDIGEVLRRLGSPQVRAVGTIGGNIANGSPIGDMPPLLIALGAEITLRRENETRLLPLERFFLEYGRQDRRPGEFLVAIRLPKPGKDTAFRAFKISKRFDQDISAVLAAFALELDGRRIASARLAFGGMAGTPRRAGIAETALSGASLDRPDSWKDAVAALADDFTPLSDHRASASYRLRVAQGLLRKALTEIAGTPTTATRLVGVRETQDA